LDDEIILLEKKVTHKKELTIEGIRFISGAIEGRQIILARTGAGKVNAAMVTTLLIEHFKPSEVIFTGIAGGINPDLLPGDIVIAAKSAQHDLGSITEGGLQNWGVRSPITGERNPVFFAADARLLTLAETASKKVQFEKIETSGISRVPEVIRGIVVTGDVFVSSSSKKTELRENFQADAVEMEGAAVAQICWQQGISCLIVRCLSDTSDENAEQDYREFYKMAARNSARLVTHLVRQLAAEQSLEK
jgi:adenosylhomocysteine nucleosidase